MQVPARRRGLHWTLISGLTILQTAEIALGTNVNAPRLNSLNRSSSSKLIDQVGDPSKPPVSSKKGISKGREKIQRRRNNREKTPTMTAGGDRICLDVCLIGWLPLPSVVLMLPIPRDHPDGRVQLCPSVT